MKRVKKFVALVAIAAITFGSTLSVFAEEATATAYNNLAHTEHSWYYENEMYGVYPVITGMDSLNEKIEEQIWKASLMSDNSFKVSYDIEDADRFATILLTFDFNNPNRFIEVNSVAYWYFVDKETMTEVAQADYDTLVAEAAAAVTEEPVAPIATTENEEATASEASDEAQMVAVREYAETLGYSVEWNDSLKAVTLVSGDDIAASFKVDVNVYTFGDETTELESAPINQDGVVYVPSSFFEKLGAKVNYAADGSVSSIVLPDGKVESKPATAPATTEAAAATPATTEAAATTEAEASTEEAATTTVAEEADSEEASAEATDESTDEEGSDETAESEESDSEE